MPAGYTWHHIEDFESDPKRLTDGELVSLGRIWARQKKELAEFQTLEEFDKRLRREWSIETGVIEKAYTLDRGVTRTLIERGIDAALIPHGATDRDSVLVAPTTGANLRARGARSEASPRRRTIPESRPGCAARLSRARPRKLRQGPCAPRRLEIAGDR